MKRSAIKAILLMLGAAASANASDGSESRTWHCMDVASAGLRWNGDTETYRDTSFFKQQYQIVQTKDQLQFPENMGISEEHRCGFRGKNSILTCRGPAHTFNLNVQTGYASHSKGFGWMNPYARPEPMFVSALTCRVQ